MEFLHPEMEPHMCNHVIYNKRTTLVVSSIKSAGATGYPYGRGNNLDPYLMSHSKANWRLA
jgi:hypothetical protein